MTKEQIYDEQINPLVVQISEICKEHKIAFIADFALDEDLRCTSADLRDANQPSANQLKALALLHPWQAFAMAVTEETKPNGDKKLTMTRIS